MHLPTANQLRVAGVALFVLGFVTAQDIQDAGAQGAAKPAAQAGGKQAPIFEVDPFWPKPLPNHWVTGSTIGLSVDDQDNVWTIHRPGTVDANFKAADLKASEAVDDEVQPGAPGRVTRIGSDRRLLQGGAADPRLRRGRQRSSSHWGGPGAGYEWPDSNHGITVDHKGNVWMAGNGGKDTQVLKFTQRREVPAAARQARRPQRQQRHRRTSGSRRRSSTSRRPTRSTSPTATATAASSSSTPTPAPTSGTGARTATSRTTRSCRRTTRRRRRRSSSAPCTASSSRTTASSTSAIG